MTTYIKYKCSSCRREKTIEQDTFRVTPNKCTITKACSGILQSLGETANQVFSTPVSGLEDWYPNGSRIVSRDLPKPDASVGIVSSQSLALTIAIRIATPPSSIDVEFEQRRGENIAFVEYTYKPTIPTSFFSGKDQSGKILRIDNAAIAEGRLTIRVNGVIVQFLGATSASLTLPLVAAGSTVNIRIQAEKDTVSRTVTLTRNNDLSPSAVRGSWANIRNVQMFDTDNGFEDWTIYSIDSFAGTGAGKLRLASLSVDAPAMVLLAHAPFHSIDRYLNFVIPIQNLSVEFPIEIDPSTRVLIVDRSAISEIYPPLRLQPSSFIEPDARATSASSALTIDGTATMLRGSKIIGAV